MKRGGLGLGRIEIGRCSGWIGGAVQVFRPQHWVLFAIPCRGGAVQLGPAGRQERGIDTFLHQCVREEELVSFRLYEIAIDQSGAGVLRIVGQVT